MHFLGGQANNKTHLRHLYTLLALPAMLALLGCDPGMTIRQATRRADAPKTTAIASSQNLIVEVKPTRQLIGESYYGPEIKVSNPFDSPITIDAVELVTKSATYTNNPRHPSTYPVVVAPGQTETLETWFDLPQGVERTFLHRPADLRIHYSRNGKEEIAHATIVGEYRRSN